jgi:hypothetical protein
MSRRALRLLTLTLAVTAAVATAPAGASAIVPYYGVDISNLTVQLSSPLGLYSDLDYAHQLHANLVRTEFEWRAFQPNGPGGLDPTATQVADAFFKRAHHLHIKVLLTLEGTPCWASSAPANLRAGCVSTSSGPSAASYPPSDPNTFARFVGQIAARYKADLAAIEVWNEPDHQDQYYFAGPNKPQRYAAILRATYRAIKHADRRIQVLAGSLVGANGVFLSALYAHGIKGYYDAISVHYYDIVLGSIRAIRATQLHHGDRRPIWLDEFGWTTCLPQRTQGGHDCVNDRIQARDLSDVFAELSRASYVKGAVIYGMTDYAQYDFGLLTQSQHRKPAFGVVARIFATHRARLSPVRVRSRLSGGRVLVYGSTPAGDAMELDAIIGPSLRWKVTFDPNRFNRFSIRLPASLGAHGIHVHVYQYWTGEGAWVSV